MINVKRKQEYIDVIYLSLAKLFLQSLYKTIIFPWTVVACYNCGQMIKTRELCTNVGYLQGSEISCFTLLTPQKAMQMEKKT